MSPTNYEEKRKHPRIVVNKPVSMVLSTGEVLNASLYDISLGGIQVHCDKTAAHKFQYEYETTKEKGTTRFPVTFKLPLRAGLETLEALCRMVYILKHSHDDYAIGLEFAQLRNDSENILRNFIAGIQK